MHGDGLSRRSRFAIRFIRTYQLGISSRLGARCASAESCSEYGLRMFEEHGFLLAGWKTLVRVSRCRPPRTESGSAGPRPGRTRRVLAISALLGLLGVMGALFLGGTAFAEVSQGCYGSANGRPFEQITRDRPLNVRQSQNVSLRGGARAAVDGYRVELYFFGIPYGLRTGSTDQNQWSGSFRASQFLTRGTGNYIVTGETLRLGGNLYCYATLYINVEGDPLDNPAGQVAGGVTATGLIGMIASAVTGGKVPPGFESTTTPEQEEDITQKQEEEKKREKQRREDEENKKLADEASAKLKNKCAFLVLPALLLAAGMMASGASAATSPVPRVRWSPRFSVVGIGSGVLFSLGGGILLQQYGVIWPTLGMGITFLVGGLLLGVLVPSLARLRAVRKVNRVLARTRPEPLGPWTPTHQVPAEGAWAWDQPDPSQEAREEIAGGLEVRLVESRGDWALVAAEDGWTGWVDARTLEAPSATPATKSRRKPSASRKKPPAEATPADQDESPPADWYPDPAGEARLRYWNGTDWTEDTSD